MENSAVKRWLPMMQPLIDKYKLAAKLNLDMIEGPEGCAAIARLMENMATIIDKEIARRDAR